MTLAGFHPTVSRWFRQEIGEPSPPQVEGWPRIRAGEHVLIAAPTGSGKTLAAFLCALDSLLRQGDALPARTEVVYVSPLRALSHDVTKNLQRPLAELRALDPTLPEVRVLVRTGDTLARERAAMLRKHPHVLVTTPESLYLLLTTERGRAMLQHVKSVIVDEIHALYRDRRGSHLALTLERLVALAGEFQRIGLSATQKPIDGIARFLGGAGREVAVVDAGHLRHLDLEIEVPSAPLTAVCSHEVWDEIYARIADLVRAHRTTLVFTNTRKLCERTAARLTQLLGAEVVTSHHGSLSRAHRLDAEQRLKDGKLKALVATASLELGIDIGDVDLVVQLGACASIATFLQRAGRAGHGPGRIPKARLLPMTIDDLLTAGALVTAVQRGELDRITPPQAPLDVLAQQVVAACTAETWDATELFERLRRADSYRDLTRADFDRVVRLHTDGRHSLLHHDATTGRLRATRRARLAALTAGGAIPDNADWTVLLEPEGTMLGTVHEDFAIESSIGDVFQLANHSWRVLRHERGRLRVADAGDTPPSLPFWVAEGPARTRELSAAVARIRAQALVPEALERELGLPHPVAGQIEAHVRAGVAALGCLPTPTRIVAERFFDDAGGMQIVLHAPFGSRINRAFGLALRKRFCRGFGFELQAAADEDAIVFSLGPIHAFPLAEIFDYLHPASVRDVLIQALLVAPMFTARWRWNAQRSLALPRSQGGKRLPAPLQRMRADDFLAKSFPAVAMCAENLPGGDLEIPFDHPLVDQTITDCLHEAMDLEGLLEVLRGLGDGTIERVAVETETPSAFAGSVLNARPYAFLDDAPLEERRTQAAPRTRGAGAADPEESGRIDAEATRRVREEVWPDPRDGEELHEALQWMGYVTDAEAEPWRDWLAGLAAAGRVRHEAGRWFAADGPREPKAQVRGRLEALGPAYFEVAAAEAQALAELVAEGFALPIELDGQSGYCERRLLRRIRRYERDARRPKVRPATAAEYLRLLARWQHADPRDRRVGVEGVRATLHQLAGFEATAIAWERAILPARVADYRRAYLDQLAFQGEVAWCRLYGRSDLPVRKTPIALVPRAALADWLALAPAVDPATLTSRGRVLLEVLEQGALFFTELETRSRMLASDVELGLAELIAHGAVTCDSFTALRQLCVPAAKRRSRLVAPGRWSLLRPGAVPAPDAEPVAERLLEEARALWVGKQLLARYGIVVRRVLLREKQPLPWRALLRELRRMELRGEVHGGRFVQGFDGEQFALPEAVALLRKVQKDEARAPLQLTAADPLNLEGIVTPGARVPPRVSASVVIP